MNKWKTVGDSATKEQILELATDLAKKHYGTYYILSVQDAGEFHTVTLGTFPFSPTERQKALASPVRRRQRSIRKSLNLAAVEKVLRETLFQERHPWLGRVKVAGRRRNQLLVQPVKKVSQTP